MPKNMPKSSGERPYYFFDAPLYPPEWRDMDDAHLVELYQKEVELPTLHNKAQLIICFLMKRHKGGITLVSRSFVSSEKEIVEFTHDLFLKLVSVLKSLKIERNLGGFLLTTIRHMHIDRMRKKKALPLGDKLNDLGHHYSPFNQVDMKLDYPLSEADLLRIKGSGLLSQREYQCINLVRMGYKPREIAREVDCKTLEMEELLLIPNDNERLESKIKKIYAAIERARSKIKGSFDID